MGRGVHTRQAQEQYCTNSESGTNKVINKACYGFLPFTSPTSNHSARKRNPYFIASSRAPLQVRGSGHLAAVATIKRLLLRSAFVAIRITRLTRIITIRSRAGKLIPSGILRNCKKIPLYSAGVRNPHACSRQRILWAHGNVIRTRFGTRCPCVQGFMRTCRLRWHHCDLAFGKLWQKILGGCSFRADKTFMAYSHTSQWQRKM